MIVLFRDVNSTTSSLYMFGKNWTVREATSFEHLDQYEKNSTEHLYRPLYLVTSDCHDDQSPVEMYE